MNPVNFSLKQYYYYYYFLSPIHPSQSTKARRRTVTTDYTNTFRILFCNKIRYFKIIYLVSRNYSVSKAIPRSHAATRLSEQKERTGRLAIYILIIPPRGTRSR